MSLDSQPSPACCTPKGLGSRSIGRKCIVSRIGAVCRPLKYPRYAATAAALAFHTTTPDPPIVCLAHPLVQDTRYKTAWTHIARTHWTPPVGTPPSSPARKLRQPWPQPALGCVTYLTHASAPFPAGASAELLSPFQATQQLFPPRFWPTL